MLLTIKDEGNPNYLPNGLINFSKFRKIAGVLQVNCYVYFLLMDQNVEQFQYQPYCLQPVHPISDFIERSIENVNYDEDAMYKKSLELEPRGSR